MVTKSKQPKAAEPDAPSAAGCLTTMADIGKLLKKKGWARAIRTGLQPEHEPPHIPTGSLTLDLATHGGWSAGQFNMVIGRAGSAKTRTIMEGIASAQRCWPNKRAAFIEAEPGGWDDARAVKIGVDMSRIDIFRPENGEMAWDFLMEMLRTPDETSIIGFDSITGAPSIKELDRDAGDAMPGSHARLTSMMMSRAGSRMSEIRNLHKLPPAVLYSNQWRSKIVSQGDPATRTGGQGQDYWCHTIADLHSKEERFEKGPNADTLRRLAVTANFARPRGKARHNSWRQVEFQINFDPDHPLGLGVDKIDEAESAYSFARMFGIAGPELAGSWMIELPRGGKLTAKSSAKDYPNRPTLWVCKLMLETPGYMDELKDTLVTLNRKKFDRPDVPWKAGHED